MTRIVQDVEKMEVCKNCSRTVGYYMKDTFPVYTKDWQGHTVSKQY